MIIKLCKTFLEQKIGEGYIVPWYLGYAYYDFMRRITVYFIFPLNYLIRWFRHICYLWDKIRLKETYIDKEIFDICTILRKEYKEKFDRDIEFICTEKLKGMFSNDYSPN